LICPFLTDDITTLFDNYGQNGSIFFDLMDVFFPFMARYLNTNGGDSMLTHECEMLGYFVEFCGLLSGCPVELGS
jgi:hypothetical protein